MPHRQGVPFHEAFDACREGDGPLSERVRRASELLEGWRFRSEGMRLTDFLWYLLRETGYYAACGALRRARCVRRICGCCASARRSTRRSAARRSAGF